MLAKTPSLAEQMIKWLKTQDPKQDYYYDDVHHCACAQFAAAIGQIPEWFDGIAAVEDNQWFALDRIAKKGKPTFGALRKRLERAG
jgi:hypothetical protein